jgi:hypothetical protein
MKSKKDENLKYIESFQKSIEESDVPIEESDDFKIWNLIPGQQLFYKKLDWPRISHHAVYVGNGKIFEGGFNPSTFYKLFMSLINAEVKLTPLKEYIQRSKKSNVGPVSVIETKIDSDKDEILKRMERVKDLLKVKNVWHPLKTNCEAMANYISHNQQFSQQSLDWRWPLLQTFIILISLCVIIWLVLH